jgi:hypothetical protein
MFANYFHTIIHMPGPGGSLAVTVSPKSKHGLHTAFVLFYFVQSYINVSFTEQVDLEER